MSLKNSNDTIGNRTRDLPAGKAVLHQLRHNTAIFNHFNPGEILK
jgi:hypothetical protein